jgi:eukaryotic-like serine/threonine-protein kinase
MSDLPISPPEPDKMAGRRFGRLTLVEHIGRSAHTMAWRVFDPRLQREFLAVMPRSKASTPTHLGLWQLTQEKLARLRHPALVPLVEAGNHDGWPYALYDQLGGQTLAQVTKRKAWSQRDAVAAIRNLGEALAVAHESGMVHGDPQPYLVIRDDSGATRWIGTGVAFGTDPSKVNAEAGHSAAQLAEADELRVQRDIARRDVLALGLLMFAALSGQTALDENDTAKVIARMTPLGREIVRLPWTTAEPISEALRAIVNRAVDRQPSHRYSSVRSLLHALDGWLSAEAGDDRSVLEQLQERMAKSGVLPASPGVAARVSRSIRSEHARTDEIAATVLSDLGLTVYALKNVNTAKARTASLAGSGPVLALRSAVALLGLDAIRRAVSALMPWPGVLNEANALQLDELMRSTHQAMSLAQELRAASWSSDVVAIVTLLQQLGVLLVQYHLPTDMAQIRRLMQSTRPQEADAVEEPGLSAQAAGFAVLGVDIESLACQVVRQWGFDEAVQKMMRRIPSDAMVHASSAEDEYLRALASCAHETVEASRLAAPKIPAALSLVVKRYGRVLALNQQSLTEALVKVQGAVGLSGSGKFDAVVA